MSPERSHFTKIGFILAAAGSAVGLGNIWKFPYITYVNEGGSFVLVYLVAIALIGAPIMMAEILIGRRTQKSPVGALLALQDEAPGGRAWGLLGGLGVTTGFLLLSYYSVVAGWTVYYFGKCLRWSLVGFPSEGADGLGASFGAFASNAGLQIGFHAVFMAITIGVVLAGVRKGIERVTKILMPVLFAMLVVLCLAATQSPGFGEAMRFLFHVGPIDRDGLLEAVGHSFFTLSLGMGAMITYGSYVKERSNIRRDALVICFLDTLIALMACVVMFSIIFGVPAAERGATFSRSAAILFTTLPRMFYELPGGSILAPLFYLLVAFAALTSTISLLEVVASYFIDQKGWSRPRATLTLGTAIFAAGMLAALSLGASSGLSSWAPLGARNAGVFGTVDYLVSNWLLPVGGFFTAVYAGWFLSSVLTRDELEKGTGPFRLHGLWKLLLRVLCPVAIAWILFAVIQGKAF